MTASRDNTSASRHDFADLIVAVARDGDQEAFARLFDHFAPRLKTVMMQKGATSARAEEIAQDTMLLVWRKARLFDPAGASASGWIYRIATNLHIDAVRRDHRQTSQPADVEPDPVPQPDILFDDRDRERRVRAAITQLNADQLRVITMSFFEDKPHAEIAAALEIPLGTVKSRVRLAMQRLRDLLDNEQ